MEKSRLGISINLFAALLFFIGVGGSVLVIAVAAGYVLLFEESERLKRTALKALILIVFLVIATSFIIWILTVVASIFSSLDRFNLFIAEMNSKLWNANYLSQFLQTFIASINNLVRIFEILIPVIFGLRAYREKDIKIKWIDNLLDKNFY